MRVRLAGAPAEPTDIDETPLCDRDKRADALGQGRLVDAIRTSRDRFTRKVADPELLTMSPIYVQAGARHILFGDTGIGKSLVTMLAAVECALRGHKVIYFAGESYEDEFDDRLQCLVRGLGFNPDSPEYEGVFDVLSENLLDLCSASFPVKDSVRALQVVREQFQPDLVIFDPYVTFATGSENDVESARDFTVALNKLFISRGIAVVVVHHSGKGTDGAPSESMRGSTHLPSWSQLTYRVTAVDVDAHMTRMVIDCKKGRPKRKPELVAYERVLSEDLTTTWFRPASASADLLAHDGERPVDQTDVDSSQLVDTSLLPPSNPNDTRQPAVVLREVMLVHKNRVFTRMEAELVTGVSRTASKELLAAMAHDGLISYAGMIRVGRQKTKSYQYRSTADG